MLRLLTAAFTAAAMILAAPIPSVEPSTEPSAPVVSARAQQWRDMAVQALAAYEQSTSPTTFRALAFGAELDAVYRLYGWDDPRIPGIISRILAERNPDGGWGIDMPRDQFNDGSTNPATTTYTVTNTAHVGGPLLEAYKAGKVAREPIQTIVNLTMSTSRINTATGQCVAYSRAVADVGPAYCVHNVNAHVAFWLTLANEAGVGARGLQTLVVGITRREVTAYNETSASWSYRDTQTPADPDHNAFEATSVQALAYPVGREAAYAVMSKDWGTDDGARGHMSLVSLPGGPGSQSGDTTLWCVMGDRWLAESQAYLDASAGDPMRLIQVAAGAAKNALAC